jgi:hypothetical protein
MAWSSPLLTADFKLIQLPGDFRKVLSRARENRDCINKKELFRAAQVAKSLPRPPSRGHNAVPTGTFRSTLRACARGKQQLAAAGFGMRGIYWLRFG